MDEESTPTQQQVLDWPPSEAWNDPDQLDAALKRASWLSALFAQRDHAQGRYAPSYGTSPEVAAAHELYCRIYDRLEQLDPMRLAFTGSGGGFEALEADEPE
jgi:hypothetical protein